MEENNCSAVTIAFKSELSPSPTSTVSSNLACASSSTSSMQHSANPNATTLFGTCANLGFEEQLANEVRKYRCLYDSKMLEYRDRNARHAAWTEIIATLGIVSVEAGEQLFTNLRKRYSKKRQDMKKSIKFGTREEAEKAIAEFEKYRFISWLEEHMKIRASRLDEGKFVMPTFISQAPTMSNNVVYEGHIPHTSLEREEEQDDEALDYPGFTDLQQLPGNLQQGAEARAGHVQFDGLRQNIRESVHHGNRQNVQSRLTEFPGMSQTQRPISYPVPVNVISASQEPYMSPLRTKLPNNASGQSNAMETLKSLDDDEIFGTMVTLELRKLGKRDKVILKRDINEAIFRAQLKAFDENEKLLKAASSSNPAELDLVSGSTDHAAYSSNSNKRSRLEGNDY